MIIDYFTNLISIWGFKALIAENIYLAAHQQQIIFCGHVLSNNMKLTNIVKIIKYLLKANIF